MFQSVATAEDSRLVLNCATDGTEEERVMSINEKGELVQVHRAEKKKNFGFARGVVGCGRTP
jgi:hypothetical protein